MSSQLMARIGKASLAAKVMPVAQAINFIKDGMKMGWSGFTPAGYPKAIPIALADRVEKTKEKMGLHLYVGASVGKETEDRWAKLGMLKERWPYQTGKNIQKAINKGQIKFQDTHLSMFAQNLEYGFYTKERKNGNIDLAIIEATEILPDGGIILGTGIGAAPEVAAAADKIIIEVNTSIPSLRGLHDIVNCGRPPYRQPFLIKRVDDRIGSEAMYVDTDKVVAIVESTHPDNGRGLGAADDISKQIANNIVDFFVNERNQGRLPKSLLPLQSGVGNIANAVIDGLNAGPFEHLTVWTEVLQDTMLNLFDSGKLDFASTTSLSFSPAGFKRYYANQAKYQPHILLRPVQISNSPEIIRRVGCISMNTPVEFDIYGHANSSHVSGTRIINGLGGSGDFLRAAYLSIMHGPSARGTKKDKTGISTVVPMVSHCDHTEHDLDILVTEQGLADLRGLTPRDRAMEIINKCAHPDFKPQLTDYVKVAEMRCMKEGGAHEPHLLDQAFKMHMNLKTKGSMKIAKWDE